MNSFDFPFHGQTLSALPSGGLWWRARSTLVVSDLHLGKSERLARRNGTLLPPFENEDTLEKLDNDISLLDPSDVVCLGDSFDDLSSVDGLTDDIRGLLSRLMAGRKWQWIEGNHDPGPVDIGGEHLRDIYLDGITMRHIADISQSGEISGHFHPKASLSTGGSRITRPCFLIDRSRIIMPAYGTYTGGLAASSDVLCELMAPDALAVLLASPPQPIPMPRRRK